ncbi:hypothetical protein HZS_614 [Henneguya salminicola]|nr:hypothetical protein HZS_614 [Henneguya salminicola]
MNPRIWRLIFISLYLSMLEKNFDSRIKKIHFRVRADVFGYSSFKNTGMDQRCCGYELNEICTPCQYIMYLKQIHHGRLMRKFVVGSFDRPSQQLSHRIHLKILGLEVGMSSRDLGCFETNKKWNKTERLFFTPQLFVRDIKMSNFFK